MTQWWTEVRFRRPPLYLPLQRNARRRPCGGALSLREEVGGVREKKVTGVPIYLPGTQLGEMFANGPVMAATAADAVAKKENAPDERDLRSNGATRVCKWSGERACDRPVGPACRHVSALRRWAAQGNKRDMGHVSLGPIRVLVHFLFILFCFIFLFLFIFLNFKFECGSCYEFHH